MTTAATKTASSRIVTRLGATNYKNLSFAPMEVPNPCFLIGPNGAGKSNFCELLSFIKALAPSTDSLATAFRQHGGIPTIHSLLSSDDNLSLSISLNNRGIGFYHFDEIELDFFISFSKNKTSAFIEKEKIIGWAGDISDVVFRFREPGQPDVILDEKTGKPVDLGNYVFDFDKVVFPSIPQLRLLADKFSYFAAGWAFYNCNDFIIKAIKNTPVPIDSHITYLAPDGSNLANVLFQMQNAPDSEGISDIFAFFIQNVDQSLENIKTPVFDNRFISFAYKRKNSKSTYSLDMLSDGYVRMLLLSSILLHPKPQSLIVIDEPELGLHPQWMKPLMELIWRAAEKTQVIIATHSPDLLDHLDADEAGHVIVAEQDELGLAQFNTLDPEALAAWLKDYTLGDLYRLGRPEVGGWT